MIIIIPYKSALGSRIYNYYYQKYLRGAILEKICLENFLENITESSVVELIFL